MPRRERRYRGPQGNTQPLRPDEVCVNCRQMALFHRADSGRPMLCGAEVEATTRGLIVGTPRVDDRLATALQDGNAMLRQALGIKEDPGRPEDLIEIKPMTIPDAVRASQRVFSPSRRQFEWLDYEKKYSEITDAETVKELDTLIAGRRAGKTTRNAEAIERRKKKPAPKESGPTVQLDVQRRYYEE